MTQDILKELYKQYTSRGAQFIDVAERHQIDRDDAKKFLKKEVIHDQRIPKPKYIPIVSKTHGAYQMDTFINQKEADGLNYLILINVNTRKAYAYPMKGKGAEQVLSALKKFIQEADNVTSITSDQDKAYLSNDVIEWMRSHKIIYKTVTDDNHNNLGIINRFMRTLRDKAYDKNLFDPNLWKSLDEDGDYIDKNGKEPDPSKFIKPKQMKAIIDAYNNTPHRSLKMIEDKKVVNNSPNDMTAEKEEKYIEKRKVDVKPYKYKVGDKVRIIKERKVGEKRRRQVTDDGYKITDTPGNLYTVSAKNDAANDYPGYKIVKAKGKVPMAEDLKDGKRGAIEKILKYYEKTDRYQVQWEGGVKQTIPAKNLREGNPTRLSRMERAYWVKHKPIPAKIRKFI